MLAYCTYSRFLSLLSELLCEVLKGLFIKLITINTQLGGYLAWAAIKAAIVIRITK